MLYAQSDLDGKTIPVTSGGCGQEHRRQVINGVRAQDFPLDCPPCEAVLRGDGKPKVLKYQVDPQSGRVLNQERVADADLQWSSTPETVPFTEDEKRTNRRFSETAQQQIEMMNALGTAIANGLAIPREMMHFLQKGLPAETLRSLKTSVVCGSGHDVPSGSAFCPKCGVSMTARAAIGSGDGEPAVDLSRLHVQSLRKMAREKGLPDKGSKDQLIQRLAA